MAEPKHTGSSLTFHHHECRCRHYPWLLLQRFVHFLCILDKFQLPSLNNRGKTHDDSVSMDSRKNKGICKLGQIMLKVVVVQWLGHAMICLCYFHITRQNSVGQISRKTQDH